MPVYLLAALGGASIVVLLLLVFLLRRRHSGRKAVLEKVGKASAAERPDQLVEHGDERFLNIVYGLAASMVVADGQVEPREIAIAEKLGARLIANFDNHAFLKLVKGHKQLPRFNDMVDAVAPLLPLPAKVEIFDYLQAIATSDGKISPDERHYIHHVEVKFGLDKLSG
jgi:uncharacterized tellurite resistance protein B-like protein